MVFYEVEEAPFLTAYAMNIEWELSLVRPIVVLFL